MARTKLATSVNVKSDEEAKADKLVKLNDLDLSMSPARALAHMGDGTVPFSDTSVKNVLRITAKDIYNHEKNITFFARKVGFTYPLQNQITESRQVRDGCNTLLWFINRVEIEKASSPASTARFYHSVTSSVAQKDVTLPDRKITPVTLAELADFEDLYYALCAKIRQLHAEMKLRLENSFIAPEAILHNSGKGEPTPQLYSDPFEDEDDSVAPELLKPDDVLHLHGEDFKSRSPFTALQMVRLLERKWALLMDPRLIFPLDMALKRKRLAGKTSKPVTSGSRAENDDQEDEKVLQYPVKMSSQAPQVVVKEIEGLKDTNRMPPCTIVAVMWEQRNAELIYEKEKEEERELKRNIMRAEIQRRKTLNRLTGMPAAAGSEEEETQTEDGGDRETETGASEYEGILEFGRFLYPEEPCACDNVECHCKSACDTCHSENCVCQTNPLFTQVFDQGETETQVRNSFQDTGDVPGQDYLFDAPTNELAQLQVAAFALPENKSLIGATKEVYKKISTMRNKYLERNARGNGETKPPKTPDGLSKDSFPLAFYGSPPASSPTDFVFDHENQASKSYDLLNHAETQDRGIGLGITSQITPPSSRRASLAHPSFGHRRSPGLVCIDEDEDVPEMPALPTQISTLSIDTVAEHEQFPDSDTIFEEASPSLTLCRSMFSFKAGSTPDSDRSQFPAHPAVRPLAGRRYVSAGGPLRLSQREEVQWEMQAPPSNDDKNVPSDPILTSISLTTAAAARPPAGRRYVSAGGSCPLEERPEIESDTAFKPSYETGHLTLEQLKNLPAIGPLAVDKSRPNSGSSSSDEGYKGKEGDAKKRIPSAEKVKKGLKKLLKMEQ